jgi:hypothetical protein
MLELKLCDQVVVRFQDHVDCPSPFPTGILHEKNRIDMANLDPVLLPTTKKLDRK